MDTDRPASPENGNGEGGNAAPEAPSYTERPPPPPVTIPVPQSEPGQWVLVVRHDNRSRFTDPPAGPTDALMRNIAVSPFEHLPLTDDQAKVVGPILNRLQDRYGVYTELMLPLDDAATSQLRRAGIRGLPSGKLYGARIEKKPVEPPSGAIRRHVVVVPAILVLLLLLAALLLFLTPQGRDFLLAAEEGWWPAMRVGLALVLIPAPILAAVAQSLDEDLEAPTANGGSLIGWLGLVAGAFGFAAGLLVSALMVDPFGLAKLVFLFLFAAIGVGLYILFAVAMQFPRVSGTLAILTLVAIGVWPAEAGSWFGSALLLGIVLAAWATLLAAVIHWYRRTRRPHWLWAGLVSLVLIGVVSHAIGRQPDWMRGTAVATTSPKLEDAYAGLLKRQHAAGAPPALVIVAAAGGGVKASYWTAKVLGQATDRAPLLRDSLFVATGVSGGSLGLAYYRALLSVPDVTCDQPGAGGPLEGCATALHRRDLLAGLVGAFGTTELVNFVLPVLPRRSIALETGWEERWRAVVRTAHGRPAAPVMGAPFRSLWQSGTATPALILNTTRPLTGDRVVVSNLDVSTVLQPSGACLANIAEQLQMPLSTAANASARFPLIEEWGWYRRVRPAAGCNPKEAIADGGFFDNYGAATALDVYRRVKQLAAAGGPRPRIVVVQISSDTDCRLAVALDGDRRRQKECDARRSRRKRQLTPVEVSYFGNGSPDLGNMATGQVNLVNNANLAFRRIFYANPREELTPPGVLGTLGNAVSTTGLAVATRLRETVKEGGDTYLHFSLGGALDIPLGWSLSRHAREEIDAQLRSPANQRTMALLVQALAPTRPSPPSPPSPRPATPAPAPAAAPPS